MKPNLHDVLYRRSPAMLVICASVLALTLLLVRFSFVYLLVSLGFGLIDAIISIDELTGGKMLSWVSVPLLMVGQVIATYLAFPDLRNESLALVIQFFALVCCVELVIVLLFRRRIERFVTGNR
jgi:hypothetical protein